ncbi:hypothetical protein EJ110_NYTH25084 [Nymphaea thermarum]|nr:hypothetical protein EJ110_NYTH25084 [Nymphaea thermarum]
MVQSYYRCFVISLCVTTIGVAVNKDFKTMRLGASSFKDGQLAYYMLGVAESTAILYLASTVMAGVLNAVTVPLTSLAAVALFHDPMSSFKILAIVSNSLGMLGIERAQPGRPDNESGSDRATAHNSSPGPA